MSNIINLNTWNEVEEYIDNSYLYIPPSYFERAVMDRRYPRDAFSKGQLASKSWLLQELSNIKDLPEDMTIAILGCWIGAIVEPLLISDIPIERIYGLDIDAQSIELAEKFNQKHVANSWKFKGVVADASILELFSKSILPLFSALVPGCKKNGTFSNMVVIRDNISLAVAPLFANMATVCSGWNKRYHKR